jgi:hypothetical protein
MIAPHKFFLTTYLHVCIGEKCRSYQQRFWSHDLHVSCHHRLMCSEEEDLKKKSCHNEEIEPLTLHWVGAPTKHVIPCRRMRTPTVCQVHA